MRETKKPVLSTAVLVVNGLLICVFLLFGAMLVYITANLSSEAQSGKAYLFGDDEKTLVFLEHQENYQQGDQVLVQGKLDGQISYTMERVQSSQDNQIVLTSNGSSFTENKKNVVGRVSFESPVFGRLLAYLTDQQNTVPAVIGCAVLFIFIICLIIMTVMVAGRRRHAATTEKRADNLIEELFDDSSEQDFLREIYRQEISEPEEVISVGDDKSPLSEEEIEAFRESVLKS